MILCNFSNKGGAVVITAISSPAYVQYLRLVQCNSIPIGFIHVKSHSSADIKYNSTDKIMQ